MELMTLNSLQFGSLICMSCSESTALTSFSMYVLLKDGFIKNSRNLENPPAKASVSMEL